MAKNERSAAGTGGLSPDDRPEHAPRTRAPGVVRALVAAAVAAAAPAAGCYESDPGDDVADSADGRDITAEVYGMPDGGSDATTVYSVPPYGAPEYAAPDYGVP